MGVVKSQETLSLFSSSDSKFGYPQHLQDDIKKLESDLKQLISEFNEDTRLFNATVFLKSPDGYMRCFASVHISPHRFAVVNDFSGCFFAHPKLAKGVVGISATDMKTILLRDLRRDDPEHIYKLLPGSSGRRDRGILCIPVLSEQDKLTQCAGAISIKSLKPDIFTDKDRVLAELFVREKNKFLRGIIALLEVYNEELYNSYSVIERGENLPVEEQWYRPFDVVAREILDEIKANNRVQHPTKIEQVIVRFLDDPTAGVNFDDLYPLFEDAVNPSHARDVLISRLNAKLEHSGYRIEQPRLYQIVRSSMSNRQGI